MGVLVTSITPLDLIIATSSPSGPTILDVRRAPAFDGASDMIATAIWYDPARVEEWITGLSRERDHVVYCVHGHEVSQNTAESLRTKGIRATYLEGGIDATVNVVAR